MELERLNRFERAVSYLHQLDTKCRKYRKKNVRVFLQSLQEKPQDFVFSEMQTACQNLVRKAVSFG